MTCSTIRIFNRKKFIDVALQNFQNELTTWSTKLSSYTGVAVGIPELILELKSIPVSKHYSAWRALVSGIAGQIVDRRGTPSPITSKDVAQVLASAGVAYAVPSAALGILAGIAAASIIGATFDAWADPAIWDTRIKCDDHQRPFPPTHPGRWDPLVVDLNGDGIKLTPLAGTKVNFDFGADGFAEQTGWVSAQDGLVVLGRNKNGKIDNGTELFGNATEDGFAALAKFDLNKDGLIDSKDSIFPQLRIWRDSNGNGVTDAGELLTFAQAGIKNIKLAKTASGADNAGNRIDFTGTFTRTDGKIGNAAAVSFAVNQTLTAWVPPPGYVPGTEAQKLPVLKGYGRLMDFVAAATANTALLQQGQALVTLASGTASAAQIMTAFDGLLYAWAGVDKLDPASRGGLVDARKLGFLAAFSMTDFMTVA